MFVLLEGVSYSTDCTLYSTAVSSSLHVSWPTTTLHNDFENKFTHLVLGADPGLARASAVVTPLDTFTGRKLTLVEGDSESGNAERASMMGWSCSGCRRARSETAFTALQLDVFQPCGRYKKARDANPGR